AVVAILDRQPGEEAFEERDRKPALEAGDGRVGGAGREVLRGADALPSIRHHDLEPVLIEHRADLDPLVGARPAREHDRVRAGLGPGELRVLHELRRVLAEARHGAHEVPDDTDVLGTGRYLDLHVGLARAGRRHDPSAWSREPKIGKTLDRPVMSKILRMRSWVATSFIEPSLSFTRFRPPTSTPRPVESRKSTFSMSTTMFVAPPSTRSMRV